MNAFRRTLVPHGLRFLPASHCRGTLTTILILFPLAILASFALLARTDMLYAETARREARAQARLLAESALAIFESLPVKQGYAPGALIHEGVLPAGRYTIVAGQSGAQGQRLVFRGEHQRHDTRYLAEYEAVYQPETMPTLRLIELRRAIEPRPRTLPSPEPAL